MLEKPRVAAFSNETGAIPPIALPHVRQVDGLGEIGPDDDVVLLYGEVLSPLVHRLRTVLGHMPPVLALTTRLDEDDVLESVRCGAASYMLEGPVPGSVVSGPTGRACLVDALSRTAAGEHCFTYEMAAFLVKGVRGRVSGPPDRYVNLLSPRERQAMDMLARGLTTREVAQGLGTTEKTTRNYLSRIYNKLQVRRQSEAIMIWLGRTPPQTGAEASGLRAS
jgi:DNA-binding NarL/FixJ family response regulator